MCVCVPIHPVVVFSFYARASATRSAGGVYRYIYLYWSICMDICIYRYLHINIHMCVCIYITLCVSSFCSRLVRRALSLRRLSRTHAQSSPSPIDIYIHVHIYIYVCIYIQPLPCRGFAPGLQRDPRSAGGVHRYIYLYRSIFRDMYTYRYLHMYICVCIYTYTTLFVPSFCARASVRLAPSLRRYIDSYTKIKIYVCIYNPFRFFFPPGLQ